MPDGKGRPGKGRPIGKTVGADQPQCSSHPDRIDVLAECAAAGQPHQIERLHEFGLALIRRTVQHARWIGAKTHEEVDEVIFVGIGRSGQAIHGQRHALLDVERVRDRVFVATP